MSANWIDTLPKDRLLAEYSLWSADAGHFVEEITRAEPYADIWHVDVCDGHFAPQLLIYSDIVVTLRKSTRRPIHVHLMVESGVLLAQLEQFAEAGADLLSVHIETDPEVLEQVLTRISDRGLKAGLVVTLETPVDNLKPYLGRVEFVTMVGTPIGIKGVHPEAATYERLRAARALIDDSDPVRRPVLAADGGIREDTVPALRAAGADTVVMGSLAFNAPDLPARMRWLHAL